MNKSIGIAAALLVASHCAHAQSSIEIYGIVDEGIEYISNDASASAAGHSAFKAISGELSGDRLGVKGSEDLGDGAKAIFTLENGFSGTTGAAAQGGRLFGRQSFVGLSSDKFGTLTMGRQYDFGYDYLGPFMSWTQFTGPFGAHVGDNDNLYQTVRSNNSIKYQTPNYSGLVAGAMYGFSNQAGAPGNNRDYSVGASYSNAPLRMAASYMRIDNPSAANNSNPNGAVGQYTLGNSSIFYNTSSVSRQSVLAAGGTYTFSPVTLGFIFSNSTIDYSDRSRLRLNNYEINAKMPFGTSWLAGVGYIYTNGQANKGASIKSFASGNHPAWHQLDLGVEYFLSKRTTLHFATVVQFAAHDATVAAINYAGAVTGRSDPFKQIGVVAGLRHTF